MLYNTYGHFNFGRVCKSRRAQGELFASNHNCLLWLQVYTRVYRSIERLQLKFAISTHFSLDVELRRNYWGHVIIHRIGLFAKRSRLQIELKILFAVTDVVRAQGYSFYWCAAAVRGHLIKNYDRTSKNRQISGFFLHCYRPALLCRRCYYIK